MKKRLIIFLLVTVGFVAGFTITKFVFVKLQDKSVQEARDNKILYPSLFNGESIEFMSNQNLKSYLILAAIPLFIFFILWMFGMLFIEKVFLRGYKILSEDDLFLDTVIWTTGYTIAFLFILANLDTDIALWIIG